jgi:conjugal transfer pilus assembly protein TraB
MVTIDGEIKGHAIGEDGKVGLRGRVVAKEGTLIARSLVAGFLSGLGQAFKPRITVTPLQLGGTTDTTKAFQLPPLGDTLEAAGVSGVGRSMELLSGYYLQQLQKIFPIIEIDAGRQVDIMILKGMPLRFNIQRTAATSAQEVVE